jgi:hypothetical protein
MTKASGVIGAFLIAIGGVLVTLSTGEVIAVAFRYSSLAYGLNMGVIFVDFAGFLLFGLGLWFIVLSGKHETSTTQSVQQPLPNNSQ